MGRYTTLPRHQPTDDLPQKMSKIPLGKPTDYPAEYSPQVLFAVPRMEARRALGLGAELPFHGADVWNAWELTWLEPSGKPVVATAVITVPADSLNIVESKSLKLYLNSLATSQYESIDEIGEIIRRDLSGIAKSEVGISILPANDSSTAQIEVLPGDCIDDLEVQIDVSAGIDAATLKTVGEGSIEEELHSHLLRSNCPVTHQPDMGSVLVRYRGPAIDRESLLRYIVSFRQQHDFHEACVERMFLDIKARCSPEKLTVYARYNRRGGLDINPFRSDFETTAENLRVWRQ
jgi:7-cyano-7-deazaguanine reductase